MSDGVMKITTEIELTMDQIRNLLCSAFEGIVPIITQLW